MSQVRANNVVNANNDGPPNFPFGATGINNASTAAYADVAGIATYAATAGVATDAQGLTGTPDITVGNITATGDASIAGTVTYEDVTSVNSIGIITATSGINVTDGGINVVGVVTATSFEGDGTNLVLDYQDLTIRNWMFGPG